MINDYSDHTTTGEVSLNNCLQPVVDLENGIQGVLLQIRSYPVTAHADVAKWFHQISISHKFRPLTSFFCRSLTVDGQMELGLGDSSWKLQPLQMKSLLMGLSQSPLFAILCKQQVGDEVRKMDAEAAEQISNLSYFDDLTLALASSEVERTSPEERTEMLASRAALVEKAFDGFSLPTKGWISSAAEDFDQQVRNKSQMDLVKTDKAPKEQDKDLQTRKEEEPVGEETLDIGLQGASESILGYSYDRRLDKIGFQKTSYINLSKRTRGVRNPAYNLTNKEEIRNYLEQFGATKGQVLGACKALYDPLGLAGVLDVSTKLFFWRLILECPKLSYKGKIPPAMHQDFEDLLVSILYIKHHVQIDRAACAPAGDYDIVYSLILTYDAASGHGSKACCVYLHIQSRKAEDGSVRITCHLILSRNRINGISSNDHQVIVELDSMRLGMICFKLAEAMLPFKIHRKLFFGDSLTALKMLHKSSLGFQVGVANILDLVHKTADVKTEVFHVAGTHLLCGVDKLTRPSKHPELLLTPEWFTGNFTLPWNCILELASPLGPAAPLKDLPGHRKEIVMLGLENLPSTQVSTAFRIQATKQPVRESSLTSLLQNAEALSMQNTFWQKFSYFVFWDPKHTAPESSLQTAH